MTTTDPNRLTQIVPSGQAASRSGTMGLLGRLSVGQKLALSALAFTLPVGVLLSIYVNNQQQGITFVRQELKGFTYMSPLEDLLKNVQADRRTATRVLQGESAAVPQQAQERKAIDDAFVALNRANQARGAGLPDYSVRIKEMQAQWKQITSQVDARTLSPDKAPKAFTDLITKGIQPLILDIANDSSLTLDPELTSYQVMDLVTNKLPLGLPVAGGVRTLGLNAIRDAAKTGGVPTDAHRTEYQLKLQSARDAQSTINRTLKYALDSSSDVQSALGPAAQDMNVKMGKVLDTFEQQIANPDRITIAPSAYNALLEPSFSAQFALYDAAVNTLGDLLKSREQRLQNQRLLALTLALLAVLAAAALLFVIARSITTSLARLARASQRVAEGDLNVQMPVTSRDEIGTVAGAFNNAVGQLRANELRNEQERQEAAKLQDNVGAFLDVTMDIAEGDLTRRGKVTEDVLGNVVDSINLMAEELSSVLEGVKQASGAVNAGSLSVAQTTERIAQGAETTARQAARVSVQVEQVTGGIRAVADVAGKSAETARLALAASQQGQQAVADTLSGMQNIRREVQGVARRIKSLGERSLEIQEIVDTISRISSQTNLLALNAAIEAAGAGEAGSRFAIVADEVRKLADSSAQATARIATLIRTVQTEIGEVTASVEGGTREVESGYRVAGSAGERLRDIAALSEQSAQLAEQISQATGGQVERVEQVDGAVRQIASVAQESNASVTQGREAAEQLRTLAAQLDASLARFRLN